MHRCDDVDPAFEHHRQVVEGDLEAGGVAVVTDAQRTQPEGGEPRLGAFDLGEECDADLGAVGHP